MTVLNYLESIGWLDAATNGGAVEGAEATLAQLLDLDLSVDLADVMDTEEAKVKIEGTHVQDLLTPALSLQGSLEVVLERYTLVLVNWERGRYRVMQGQRARSLIVQEGFGKADSGSERWVRTGRMIWLSVLEFVETHFKRARMKMRVAQTTFRQDASPMHSSLEQLLSLDHILLKAKLRRLDEAALWLARLGQKRFREQWQNNRPPLETDEALEGLVDGLSMDGWLGTFIAEFGHAFALILTMEVEAATVLQRAFSLNGQPQSE